MVAGFESMVVSLVALEEGPIVSHDGMGVVVTSGCGSVISKTLEADTKYLLTRYCHGIESSPFQQESC
jgi:uncharacterized protein YceK